MWFLSHRHRGPFIGLLSFLLLLFVQVPGVAQFFELDSFTAQIGQTLIVNTYTEDAEGNAVQGSDVSPIRLTLGGGARFRLPGQWRAAVWLHLWSQEYLETPDGPVVPTQIETGSAAGESLAKTLGIVLGLPLFYEWEPAGTPGFSFGGGVSPSLVFRIPYSGIDGANPDGVRSYYLSNLRWFYPETMIYSEYALNESVRIGLTIRAFWPIYNSWDGEDTSFLDETLVSFLFGVRYIPGGE
jgi:hypothetical protein